MIMILKIAEKVLLEIATKKISKNDAHNLYNSMIKPGVNILKKATSRGKNKGNNILNVSNDIGSSLFDGVYSHYKNVSKETIFERSISERSN